MPKGKLIGVRMNAIEAKRVELKSQELGLTVSGYIRHLIEQDKMIGTKADLYAGTIASNTLYTTRLVEFLFDQVAIENEAGTFRQEWKKETLDWVTKTLSSLQKEVTV